MSKLVRKKNLISDQNLRASQSSYGHSGSGSGYGDHGSYSSGGGDCCPLVVDPLTYAALIGFIGLATYFFREFIAMSMLMMARKRRRKRDIDFKSLLVWDTLETLYEGKPVVALQKFYFDF